MFTSPMSWGLVTCWARSLAQTKGSCIAASLGPRVKAEI